MLLERTKCYVGLYYALTITKFYIVVICIYVQVLYCIYM